MVRVFLVVFSFFSIQLVAQINISGVVTNSDTKEPLVYTNIVIEGTSIGTITNKDGYFKLKIKEPRKRNLIIGFIGFEQKIFASSDIIPDTIYLHPKTHILNEVAVVGDGNALNILTKAYKNIEKNYPQKTTQLVGYYREITKDDFDHYLNLSEGVLDFVKSKYNKGYKGDIGQLKINKARTYFFPAADSISSLEFIGSHFVAGNTDFVKKRSEFINPKFFDHYKYSLTRILLDGDKEVYEIHFSTENGKLKGIVEGKLLIDSETYAYKGADIQFNEKGIKKRNALRFLGTPYKSLEISHKIRFQRLGDKWHLKYATFKGKGLDKSTKKELIFLDDFVVNEVVVDHVKPIPLEERILFGEVFTRRENNDFNFFKEYSILEKDESLDSEINLINKKLENEKNKKKQLIKEFYKLIPKLEFGYEAGYFPISMQAQLLQINGWGEGNIPIEIEKYSPGFSRLFSSYFYTGFKINKRWAINIGTHKNYDKKRLLRENEIGGSYTMVLKKIGRPLLLRPGIYLSTSNINIRLEKTDFGEENYNWRIGEDVFNIQNIGLEISSYFIKAKPSLNLSYSIRNRIWLNLGVDFNLPLKEKSRLIIKSQNFDGALSELTEKGVYDLTNDFFAIKSDGEILENLPIKKRKPTFRLGIRFHL